MKKYLVRLEQHEWVHTESFEFEGSSPEDAKKQAQKFVDKYKEIQGEYRLHVEEQPVEHPETDVIEGETVANADGTTGNVLGEGGVDFDKINESNDASRPIVENNDVVDNATIKGEQ